MCHQTYTTYTTCQHTYPTHKNPCPEAKLGVPTRLRQNCLPLPRGDAGVAVDEAWSKYRIPESLRVEVEGICADCAGRLGREMSCAFRRWEVEMERVKEEEEEEKKEKEKEAEEEEKEKSDASDLALPEPEFHPARPAYYRFNRAEIQAQLTTFTNQWKNQVDCLIQTTNQASLLRLDKEVHHHLVAWLRGLNSTSLGIQGPHGVSQPSQNSMTAVSLAALARKNNIPCIVYFCTFTDQHSSGISKVAELRSLLASIVTQLVQFIPDKGYAEVELSPERFTALTQGGLDVVETLQLIRDVRNVGPRLVYGFVDNIQVLEDRTDDAYNRDFLRVIAALCRLGRRSQLSGSAGTPNEDEDEGSVLSGTRICFTTDGYVDGLAQAVELQLVEKAEFDIETNERLGEEAGGTLVWDTKGRDDD